MRILRDIAATIIVGLVFVLYIAVLGGGTVWVIADARGVAAAGLILGLAACIAGGDYVTDATARVSSWRRFADVVVIALVALGAVTLVTNGWVVLAAFVGLLLFLWLVTTARHIARSSLPTSDSRKPAHA